MAKFEAEFYENAKGEQPVKEFLLSLDPKMRAKLLHLIGLLQDNGPALREPYSNTSRRRYSSCAQRSAMI